VLTVNIAAAEAVAERSAPYLAPIEFSEQVITPAMDRVGAAWEAGTVALSQVYMAGRICEDLVDARLPLGAPERKTRPRIAVAALEDYHGLGKRIVMSVLRAAGYDPLDYGEGVPADDAVAWAVRDDLDALLLSALMLRSALRVERVVAGLREAGSRIKVIVGGAPFRMDRDLWQVVGADAMGAIASDALGLVRGVGEWSA